jgi:glutamate-5-semialdehyde dehydrogenase
VHKAVAKEFLYKALPSLDAYKVELRCDAAAKDILGDRAVDAAEEDWDSEYGDYILAVRTVEDTDEAIAFINAHGTGHSEAIVTRNYFNAQKFLDAVDAAAVYVNASTRFTDGGEFGLGAEIGISTQKMHARGPMGLKELTSSKYIIYGEGQVR